MIRFMTILVIMIVTMTIRPGMTAARNSVDAEIPRIRPIMI